jgi:hypothetical protein
VIVNDIILTNNNINIYRSIYINSFNDEVCEYTPTPITENFKSCPEDMRETTECPTGCGKPFKVGIFLKFFLFNSKRKK